MNAKTKLYTGLRAKFARLLCASLGLMLPACAAEPTVDERVGQSDDAGMAGATQALSAGLARGACARACDDGDPCTADICDDDALCQHLPTIASCDDGDTCTGGDRCSQGACVPGEQALCDNLQALSHAVASLDAHVSAASTASSCALSGPVSCSLDGDLLRIEVAGQSLELQGSFQPVEADGVPVPGRFAVESGSVAIHSPAGPKSACLQACSV